MLGLNPLEEKIILCACLMERASHRHRTCSYVACSIGRTDKILTPFEGAPTCLWETCSIWQTHKIPAPFEGSLTCLWEACSIRWTLHLRRHSHACESYTPWDGTRYQLYLKGTHMFVRDALRRMGTQDTNSTWEASYSSRIHSSPWNIDFRQRSLTRLTLM